MTQAAGILTAIRQLMFRGRPPKSTSSVRLAHIEFAATLAGNVTHPIYLGANAHGRADYLEKVFAALHAYLSVIVGDTAENIPGGALDGRYLDNLFQDLSADAVEATRNAAEEMREDETRRAP